MASDSTTRFSSRVADYVSFRPSYPASVAHLLREHFNLTKDAHVVDLGSGTGILSTLLLKELAASCPSLKITGIEPNKDMRGAAEQLLKQDIQQGSFVSIDGTAETTHLPDHSVDLIVAGQAFHWFDVPKTRAECRRILKRNSSAGVALIWNDRRGVRDPSMLQDVSASAPANSVAEEAYGDTNSPVTSAYELLLVKRSVDYKAVDHHRKVDKAALDAFFGPRGFEVKSFENPYKLSFEQLKGRLLSSSYTPQKGQEGHEEMLEELRELFERFQKDGKVDFVYDARVFFGRLSE